MPPTLHLVRHAQGYHEITPDGNKIHDPEITPKGRDQCLKLRERFPYHDEVDLLLASPLKRTLETALLGFQPVVERGLRVLAIPSAQEATADLSDTGSDKAILSTLFDDHVDLRYLTPGWNSKTGEMATDVHSTVTRARRLRQWIKAREEKEVVLVSHGMFAHFLTGDVDAEGNQTTPWWINDEFRTFTFVDGEEDDDDDGDARIVETKDSEERRRRIAEEGEGPSLAA